MTKRVSFVIRKHFREYKHKQKKLIEFRYIVRKTVENINTDGERLTKRVSFVIRKTSQSVNTDGED